MEKTTEKNNASIVFFLSEDRFFLSHFKNRADLASRHGYQVYVLAKKTSGETVRHIEDLGYRFLDSGISRGSISPVACVKDLIRVYKIYKKISPKIVHHFGAKSIFLGTAAAKIGRNKSLIVNNLTGLGYVFAETGNLYQKCLRRIMLLGYRLMLDGKGDVKVISENKDDIEYFIKHKALRREHASYIPGAGVDVGVFCPAPDRAKGKICIMCSRLIREKGVETYLKAAQIVHKYDNQVEFWLLGDPDVGNPHCVTRAEIENWNQGGIVKMFGYRKDVEKYLQMAKIFCFPSYYREGLPKCLIEAAACGLPIITTNNIGCRDVVNRDNGILISPKSPTELADAIIKVISDDRLCEKMGRASRELALNKFSNDKILSKMEKIYNLR